MLNAELTEFARAIQERRSYPVPLDEILHGMSVFDAIVEAARSNEIVTVRG
jgi:predicted dehydrogenase